MKYTIATNFDNKLLQSIAEFGTVESVYGKLLADPIGGGRVGHVLPNISLGKLKSHIDYCHRLGIKFNYLLNASCLNNIEVTRKYSKVFSFINKIVDLGVDAFTLANMNLLKMVRKHFPEMKLATSLFLQTRSLDSIKFLEDCGADEITLYYNFNRNFDLLEKAVRISASGTRFRIIANNTCLHDCSELKDHANYIGHMTQSRFSANTFTYDTYRLNCGLLKVEHPTKLLNSEWIRPEDVHYYDEIGKGKIIFKLTDRISPTEWLIKVVKSYSAMKTDGNLAEILNFAGNKNIGQLNRSHIMKGVLRGNVKPKNFKNFISAGSLVPVNIDSQKLEGFLEGMQKIDCANALCNDRGWNNDAPGKEGNDAQGKEGCTYCRNFARQAITIDERKRLSSIEINKQLLNDIYSGRF